MMPRQQSHSAQSHLPAELVCALHAHLLPTSSPVSRQLTLHNDRTAGSSGQCAPQSIRQGGSLRGFFGSQGKQRHCTLFLCLFRTRERLTGHNPTSTFMSSGHIINYINFISQTGLQSAVLSEDFSMVLSFTISQLIAPRLTLIS